MKTCKLSDEYLVKKCAEWAINKGYEYDSDIPCDEVVELLNLK